MQPGAAGHDLPAPRREGPMAVRAMWKGVLELGAERVPVKLYSALERRSTSFRLLHAPDHVPVRQEMVSPTAGEPVARDAVQWGVEVEEGVFAVLSSEDLEELEPPSSRSIEITRFVPMSAVDDRWYDRPWWLGPDGDPEPYFALVQALRDEGREGIARWVMRKKRYQAALRVRGQHLVLVRLRHAEEVVPVSAVQAPAGREADDKELKLAHTLVDALAGPFDPTEFPETYEDRVRELVASKARGEAPQASAQRPPRREEASLEEALQASLRAVGAAGA